MKDLKYLTGNATLPESRSLPVQKQLGVYAFDQTLVNSAGSGDSGASTGTSVADMNVTDTIIACCADKHMVCPMILCSLPRVDVPCRVRHTFLEFGASMSGAAHRRSCSWY